MISEEFLVTFVHLSKEREAPTKEHKCTKTNPFVGKKYHSGEIWFHLCQETPIGKLECPHCGLVFDKESNWVRIKG